MAVAATTKDTASGEDTPQHEPFSSKLASYLTRWKEHGPISIDFTAAIMAILAESTSRKPTYEIVFGDTLIGIQLGSLSQDISASSPSQAGRTTALQLFRSIWQMCLMMRFVRNFLNGLGSLTQIIRSPLKGLM